MKRDKQKREMAMFELEQLERAISRHEDYVFKIRGWLFTILLALTASTYSKAVDLNPYTYLLVSVAAIVLFSFWEILQRKPKRRAINRSKEIEIYLRGEYVYHYTKSFVTPQIGVSLEDGEYSWWKEFRISLVYVPYLVSLLLVFGSAAYMIWELPDSPPSASVCITSNLESLPSYHQQHNYGIHYDSLS